MTGTGEAVTFAILAPVALIAALGMLFVRKAVHSALMLALVMLCLAVMYLAQDAPFLGVVQVFVYTGAIMMLFLFVLMLVGVDSSDSMVETLRGQRVAGVCAGLGFGLLLVLALSKASFPNAGGLERANSEGNVEGLATLIFTRYAFAFEVTSALLITAGIGAMVLAHRERHVIPLSQREQAEQRVRDMATGRHPGMLPTPGVYARHNAVDVPALLPDGSPSELSVSGSLSARGDVRSSVTLAGDVGELALPSSSGKDSVVGPAAAQDADAPENPDTAQREEEPPR